MSVTADQLHHRIQALTPEQLAEIETLIIAFEQEERMRATRSLAEPAFSAIWNDPANDVYDAI